MHRLPAAGAFVILPCVLNKTNHIFQRIVKEHTNLMWESFCFCKTLFQSLQCIIGIFLYIAVFSKEVLHFLIIEPLLQSLFATYIHQCLLILYSQDNK